MTATNGDGSNAAQYDSEPAGGEHVDKEKVINLFENPIAANIDGVGGPEIIKGGVTLNQVVNLGVAVGQNLPYNHVVQAWNAETGASLPTFPQAVEDFQLLSSPMVADLSDAPGNEVVVGTGLYYLRNFNVAGHRGHRLAEVHRRVDLRHADRGRRGRRRRPRGDDAHARGLRLHVGHRPARPAAPTTSGGPRATTSGTPATTAPTAGRPARRRQLGVQPERLADRADVDGARATTGSAVRRRSTGCCARRARSCTPATAPSWVTSRPAQPVRRRAAPVTRGAGDVHFAVLYKDEAGNWGRLASTSISYARPAGASPVRASLVPGVRRVHRARPHPRPAARRPLLQPARAKLAHPDRRDARRERRGIRDGRLCAARGDAGHTGHDGRRGRRLGRRRGNRRPLRRHEHGLPVRPGLRLHRQAAGPGVDADHGQGRTGPAGTRTARGRHDAGDAGDLCRHRRVDDRSDLRAEHHARCADPGSRAREGPGDLATRARSRCGTRGRTAPVTGRAARRTCGDGDEATFLRQGIFVP